MRLPIDVSADKLLSLCLSNVLAHIEWLDNGIANVVRQSCFSLSQV